jgi:transposase-like protein
MTPKTRKSSESVVKEVKRRTRRKFNSEEKIRIILEGLKGEGSISAICRREGIAPSLYYKWSRAFSAGRQTQVQMGWIETGAIYALYTIGKNADH